MKRIPTINVSLWWKGWAIGVGFWVEEGTANVYLELGPIMIEVGFWGEYNDGLEEGQE